MKPQINVFFFQNSSSETMIMGERVPHFLKPLYVVKGGNGNMSFRESLH